MKTKGRHLFCGIFCGILFYAKKNTTPRGSMGSVNKQTDSYLRSVKPGNPQKIGFGGRLYMRISSTGSPTTGGMSWRMNYVFEGKNKTLSLGKYPAVTIRDARSRRDEAYEARPATGCEYSDYLHTKDIKSFEVSLQYKLQLHHTPT